MSGIDLDSLADRLGKTSIPQEGVSFASQSLKLNNKNDAQIVVDKINACPNMVYLNLEGNTMGVEAAEAIAKALESKSSMKRALWKDMFTGRLKNEIPKALKHLGQGLIKARAQLEVLDLSDNASGPIGVDGITELLLSPTCYTLKELRLNNMGLGVGGAKLLAAALKDCYNESKKAGKPLALKVFIAGRNRLENEGTKALAAVFEEMGSLEEIQIPQNGIYKPGFEALSKAFMRNPNLKHINVNDNTLKYEASIVALTNLHNLVTLDLGDCLIKTKGAHHLANALKGGHHNLEEVIVSFNGISIDGGLAIAESVLNKPKFKTLVIDGNRFGNEGIDQLRAFASTAGKSNSIGSMSEDEGDESDESEVDDEGHDYRESGSEEDYTEGDQEEDEEDTDTSSTASSGRFGDGDNIQGGFTSQVSASEFLQHPNEGNFEEMGPDQSAKILNEIKTKPSDTQLDELMQAIIKVSSLIDPQSDMTDIDNFSSEEMITTQQIYTWLFQWAVEYNRLSYVNNTLPVHLGLIKDEETRKPVNNEKLAGCVLALKSILHLDIIPQSTKVILDLLINVQIERRCSQSS